MQKKSKYLMNFISRVSNKVEKIRGDKKVLLVLAVAVLIVLAIYLRYRLIPGVNGDYTIYISKWYEHLRINGFSGFKDDFANYNFPYLFLLYLATLVPIDKLVAVKLISIIFDFVLAYGVYLTIKGITNSSNKAIFVGLFSLFIPTVFINSAYWGQTDAIYVSFILLSLGLFMKEKYRLAWIIFGVSLAFKMQAIFFLPVLFYIWYNKKGRWFDPLYSIGTFLLFSIPPIFAGKGLADTLSVYIHQYGYSPLLSANVPNFYYFIPSSYFSTFNSVGVIFAIAIVVLFTWVAIAKIPYSSISLIYLTVLSSLLIPFILPQMHDRYFYLFEISTISLMVVLPKYILVFLSMQFVTLNVYMLTLLGGKSTPFGVLAGLVTIVFAWIFYDFYLNHIYKVSKLKSI